MKNSDVAYWWKPWLWEHDGWHASPDYLLVYVIVASGVLYFLYLSLGMFIEEEIEHLRADKSKDWYRKRILECRALDRAPVWYSGPNCSAAHALARGRIPRCACWRCEVLPGISLSAETLRKGRPSLFSAAFHTRTRYRKLGILALKVVIGTALSVYALEFLGIWESLWWYLWGGLMEFVRFAGTIAVVFLSLAISALPFLVIALGGSDGDSGHPHSRAGNWKKYDKYWPGPPFSR
jgi:hypothetical protein